MEVEANAKVPNWGAETSLIVAVVLAVAPSDASEEGVVSWMEKVRPGWTPDRFRMGMTTSFCVSPDSSVTVKLVWAV